jgi:iron complex outermembrane recepter protein
VRAKFLLTPTDSTRILLAFNHFYTRGEQGLGFNQVPDYIAAGAPGLVTGAKFVGWYNTEDFKNDVSVIKHDMVELRIEQETDVVKLVDILGWQRMNGYAQFAQDGSPLALVDTRLNQKGRDWSNEFQVLNSPDAPYASWLTWIAGAFYLHDDSGYGNAILRGAAFGFPVQTTPPSFSLLLNDNVDTSSIAGFAQATVELLPKLKLTGGARYTRDERTFTGGLYLSPALGGGPAGQITTPDSPGASKGWSMNTYRASLDYHFTDDLMVYFSFNRGTKSGQYDTFGTAATGPVVTPPVNPEVIYAYEVGMKSEWLDHRVRLNLAAFHYDISNLQFAVIVPGGTRLVNAAGAEVDGGEVDARARVIDNLTLSAGLSIQEGHYTSFPGAPAYFTPGGTIDAAGNPTVHTPEFTGTFSADYVIPSEIGDFDLNANFTHTSSFEFFPDKSLQQPATNIFNASVAWTAPDGQYDVRLWGANITGEKYYSFGSESAGLGKQFSPAAPATFGVTFGVHFSGTGEETPAPAAYVPPPVQTPAATPKSYLVFFDFNKSDLTPQAVTIVNQAAANSGPAKVTQLTVTGHTDTVGSDAYNMRLSRRRAESVAAQLEKDGIPSSEIQIVAKGKRDLLVPTADGVKEPQNRRVQIVYDGGPTS